LEINIEDYIYLVKQIARSMKRTLPPQVDVEDLESAGYLGLIDAAGKYDSSRKTKFATYATPRIRGAIGDELRRVDWVPRLVRQRKEVPIFMAHFSDISRLSSNDDDDNNSGFVVEDNGVDQIKRIDMKLRMKEAILQLKPKYQEAVYLYYFDGWTLKEAARYMGTTESRVCQILKRARPILKRILKNR